MLAPVRLMIFQPYVGARYAELLEIPVMLAWIWQAAQLTMWQLDEKRNSVATPLLIGALSLALLLIAELSGTAMRQGGWSSVLEVYFSGRDLVSGSGYGLALVLYAVMPWYIWNFEDQDEDSCVWELDLDEGEEYCDR